MIFKRALLLLATVPLAGCGASSEFQQAWNAYRSKHSIGSSFPVYGVSCKSVNNTNEYEVFFCDFKYESLKWGGTKEERSGRESLIHFKGSNLWKINKPDA